MCYQWGKSGAYIGKKELNSINYDAIKKIVEYCEPWKPVYGLFGGEPLLYERIWEIIEIMKGAGSYVYIDTNGTLIGPYARKIVDSGINRLWISLDGTEEINDKQRGKNLYHRVVSGIDKLFEIKNVNESKSPEIGITYIVTPLNHLSIETLLCNALDISKLDNISIELQNFITRNELNNYQKLMSENFNIQSFFTSSSILGDKSEFSKMDFKAISDQISKVKIKCEEKGVKLYTSPNNTEKENIEIFFSGDWTKLKDRKCSCRLPWLYTEITANGNVSTCHTFYDYTIGNIYENDLFKLFNNHHASALRKQLSKDKLFPICMACSRYYADMNRI